MERTLKDSFKSTRPADRKKQKPQLYFLWFLCYNKNYEQTPISLLSKVEICNKVEQQIRICKFLSNETWIIL